MKNKERIYNDMAGISDIFDDFVDDFVDNFKFLFEELEETKPIKFYRKIRTRKGIKRRYMIRINPLHDLILDQSLFSIRRLKHGISQRS